MSENKSSYSSILKATSIFGGIQFFNILVTLIRGKTVAFLIGTVGMGLNGLLLTGLNLIRTISTMGVTESVVKFIANENNIKDELQFRKLYQTFRRLIWISAIIGVVLTISFSPLLSKFLFGNYEETSSFVWLSVTFIFGALSGGVFTMLRATRQLKYLAQAHIIGGIVGLVVGLPILYYYGIDGVVPSIIVTTFASYLVSLYFKSKYKYEPINISWSETFQISKPIVVLGTSLTFISILESAGAFVVSAFISKIGSLSDVGLYSAGSTIIVGYVGMVFKAIASDFFPRLSGLIDEENKWKKLVNEQAELILIILGIVLILLLVTTPILIRILLSKEFLAAENFIQFAVLSIPLKGLVWVLDYLFIAKANNRLYLFVKTMLNIMLIVFNLVFYYFYGLTGLGISLSISFTLSFIISIYIVKKNYNFNFSNHVYKLLFVNLLFLFSCIGTIKFLSFPYNYILETLVVLIALAYNIYELNNRISFKEVWNKVKSKFTS